MESLLKQITSYLITQSWQIALLTIAVAFISFLLKNKSAHVRYLLWMIVLAKCIVPSFYNIPLAVLPVQEQTEYIPTEPKIENIIYNYPFSENIASETPLPISTAPELVAPDIESQPVAAANKSSYNARALFAIIWLAGTFIFAFYYISNAIRTELWLRRNRKELPGQYKSDIEKLFKDYGVKRMPNLWLLDKVNQPFVWGLVRGNIYLPAEMIYKKQMKFHANLIGHELCHVIRFDAFFNSLQLIAQAAFWFHPLVWWTNRQIRIEREKCCDEMTIARLNALPEDYSNAIVEILAAKYERVRRIPSLAVAGNVKNIEERIKIMLTPGKIFYKRPGIITATIVILIALITVPTALVLTARAQIDTSDPNQNSSEQPVETNIYQASFQYDTPITITLLEYDFNNLNILEDPIVKFYLEDDTVYATIDFEYSSWPKTKWQVQLYFFDTKEHILKNIQAEFENSGTIEKYPHREQQEIKIECGKLNDFKDVATFRLNLESIYSTQGNTIKFNEQIPLDLELGRLGTVVRVISLYWVQFTNHEDTETVSLKVNADMLTCPKTKWQITAAVYDGNGNLFGKSNKIIENSGWVLTYSMNTQEKITILITGNKKVALADIKRYEITVENIIDNSQNPDILTETSESQPVLTRTSSEEIQNQGEAILRKMAEINRYWLSGPVSGVNNYSYEFILSDKEPKEIEVKRPAGANNSFRQGISYYSILHKLASQPTSAVINAIQEDGKTIRLDFNLKESMKIALGNGISGSWHGYFSTGVDSGSIWLDAEKLVPVKAISGRVEENFSNFAALEQSHYVPLSIRIDKDVMHFDWKFKLYEPGLWLFDNAKYKLREGEWEPVASISNVKINAKPAEPDQASTVTIPLPDESDSIFSVNYNTNEPNIKFTTQEDLIKLEDIIKANQTWLLPSLENRRGLVYQYKQEEPYLETIMFDENGNIMSQLQSCKDSPNEPTNQLLYMTDGTYIRSKYEETFVRPQKLDIDEQNRDMSLIKKDRVVKNLATGLNMDCALTLLARQPEIFLAKIKPLDNNTYKLILNTSSRDAKIFTGTMLTFTSWAYMHDVRYSKSEIIFDTKTNMPLSEKDYSNGSNLVASYTFSDYLKSSGGIAPGKINALIPYQKDGQDNSLEMEAVFDFVRPNVWLLKTCHSKFKNGESSSTGTVKILPVTENSFQPIEQLLERIENTNQIFKNLNDAKEGRVIATLQPDKSVPVFARAIWSEEAKSYISDLKNAAGYEQPLIGVVEAKYQKFDSDAIRVSLTLFSNLYWKEFLTVTEVELFDSSGKSLLKFDIPVTQRIEESPGITETSVELPATGNFFSIIDKIAITPKVTKMTATYHGHGEWITFLGTKSLFPPGSVTINGDK